MFYYQHNVKPQPYIFPALASDTAIHSIRTSHGAARVSVKSYYTCYLETIPVEKELIDGSHR